MMGVIIGVFAVVSLVSLGIGVQNWIQDQFESLGSNLIFVVPGSIDFADDPAKNFGNNKLDEKHVELIEKYAGDYVENPTGSIRSSKTTKYKTKKYLATVSGAGYAFGEILNIELESGRFYTETEQDNSARVIVIGPFVADELFASRNPIGQKIKVDDKSYEVIGLAIEKGPDFDDNIYMPYTTYRKYIGDENFASIAMNAKNSDNLDLVMKNVELALLNDLKSDEFSVVSQEDLLSSFQDILAILTTAISAIAGISLLVGGIGIMNIMLVSVTERTREVGLRKALGATPLDITTQFLFESIMLSVGGGMIGLFFGWVAARIGSNYIRTEVPMWTIVIAFGFSVLVGVIFGTYPAIKAGKKDPIEALRYE
ncbi:ABC transporter permease [Patescibacteria group bacterium]